MGLDMYLYTNSRKVSQEVNDQTDEWESSFQTPRGIAIQWRKANAIHKWFVDNVQGGNDDCGIYEVSMSELALLHDTCKKVLENTELVDVETDSAKALEVGGKWFAIIQDGQKLADPTLAMELLPTMEGFFFGPKDYDQYYWWDLQYTVRKIEKIMENLVPAERSEWNTVHKDEPDWYVKFYYHSSW